jgi:hypothetical protein
MMSEKKLFVVVAMVEVELVVYAMDDAQANEIGQRYWMDEIREAGIEATLRTYAVEKRKDISCFLPDMDLEFMSPYGPENEPSIQESIDILLKKQGIE